jgi:hypothetical protein
MDPTLFTFLALGVLLVCIYSYPDMFISRTLENMNTEEIITDFEKIIQNENNKNNKNDKNDKNTENFTVPLEQSEFAKGYGWDIYTQGPFYELKTHPRNPTFYVKPLYRKPYNFPFKYESSYPIPHLSPYKI